MTQPNQLAMFDSGDSWETILHFPERWHWMPLAGSRREMEEVWAYSGGIASIDVSLTEKKIIDFVQAPEGLYREWHSMH